MRHIGCIPSRPAPASSGGRVPGLIRQLAPVLPLALVAALGCREDVQSPTVPESEPALATTAATGALSFRQVSAGNNHTCGVTQDHRAFCWGLNYRGQLGDGTTAAHARPAAVAGRLRFRHVTAGLDYVCGLAMNGRIYCWGYNEFGQLGDGTITDSPLPVGVAGLPSSVRAVTTGGNFSCALMTDGGVTCWGLNAAGQLGDGTYIDRPAPVDVAGLAGGVSAIAAGFYHVCGITKDGGVTCWGGNESGQLGIGTTSDSPTMTGVKNADGTPLIAAGGGDSENSNLLPIAVAVLVGVLLILAAGGFWLARRRGH